MLSGASLAVLEYDLIKLIQLSLLNIPLNFTPKRPYLLTLVYGLAIHCSAAQLSLRLKLP